MKEESPIIYHYTDAAALRGIVSGTFWLSNIMFLNDSKEFTHGLEVIGEMIEGMRQSQVLDFEPVQHEYPLSKLADDIENLLGFLSEEPLTHPAMDPKNLVYIGSFSSKRDDLSQWRAYSPRDGGYALGFDREKLKDAFSSVDALLEPCIYDREKQVKSARELFRGWFNGMDGQMIRSRLESWSKSVLLQVMRFATTCKHEAFRSEEEHRLCAILVREEYPPEGLEFGSSESFLKPRWEYKSKLIAEAIKEVWIGPSKDLPRAWKGVLTLLNHYDLLNNVAIHRSSAPFRAV